MRHPPIQRNGLEDRQRATSGGELTEAGATSGDAAIGIGATRTQTFPELQQALAANSGNVEVVFLNVENKKVEKSPPGRRQWQDRCGGYAR